MLTKLQHMETRSLVGNDRMDTKSHSGSERKGHKRKLADTSLGLSAVDGPNNHLIAEVRGQVDVLRTCLSWRDSDRTSARRAAHALAELAKHGENQSNTLQFFCICALCRNLRVVSLNKLTYSYMCLTSIEFVRPFSQTDYQPNWQMIQKNMWILS